ncbi:MULTISPECIES: helix-turn-helix transcriptional regulator [unclassified Microbacterium]|uniref:helix-turn-helix transcriptional regulator n=1 Tax=unclassified Microbacterium TaxID=2609290 RepID=UPI0012FCB3B0|nr:helix-turn-helix transcriptional regulator [Microbacterium sp. MAH-37]MVQ42871.1 LuxR family transcriptional regulator [Microbacterium sp. MAH-37]
MVVGSAAVADVRDGIERMSRSRLPASEFLTEAAEALSRAVPSVAACVATLDPATAIVTGVTKRGVLAGRNESDVHWARIEYGGDDPTAVRTMVARRRTAIGVDHEFGGAAERSMRMAELLMPVFGFTDEARVVFTDRAGAWGAISMFRGSDDRVFDEEDLACLDAVVPAITRGIRGGLLAQTRVPRDDADDVASAVVIVDEEDRMVRMTPGARSRIEALARGAATADPLTILHSLVQRARRADPDVPPARIRLRTPDGCWLVLSAERLEGGRGRDIVVTIDDARPHEIVDLVAAAFGLTARERDVVALVLRGRDTREIASTLFLSPYTVQDHLKAVFDKAGVTSRRQLVARVYFDHYAPRGDKG